MVDEKAFVELSKGLCVCRGTNPRVKSQESRVTCHESKAYRRLRVHAEVDLMEGRV